MAAGASRSAWRFSATRKEADDAGRGKNRRRHIFKRDDDEKPGDDIIASPSWPALSHGLRDAGRADGKWRRAWSARPGD